MGEQYLTMAEIEKLYPNQWVLINRPTTKRKSQAVTGGYVVLHCPDRVEFIRRVCEWSHSTERSHSAVQYVGKFPDELDEPVPPDEPGSAPQ